MIHSKIIKKNDYIVSSSFFDKNNKFLNNLERARDIKKQYKKENILTLEKDERSKRRTKSKIREIIECNINHSSKFVTLTYAENMQDYKQAGKNFNSMLSYIKEENKNLSYIKIIEHQKRGAIHFHLITFNLPNLDFSKYWVHGFVQSKEITDFNTEKLTNYFASYLTKKNENKEIAVGIRKFGCSQDLKKYYIIKSNSLLHNYNDYNILLNKISIKNNIYHSGLIDYEKYLKIKENF